MDLNLRTVTYHFSVTNPGRRPACWFSLRPRGWWRRTPTHPGGPSSEAAGAGNRWPVRSTMCDAPSRSAGDKTQRCAIPPNYPLFNSRPLQSQALSSSGPKNNKCQIFPDPGTSSGVLKHFTSQTAIH